MYVYYDEETGDIVGTVYEGDPVDMSVNGVKVKNEKIDEKHPDFEIGKRIVDPMDPTRLVDYKVKNGRFEKRPDEEIAEILKRVETTKKSLYERRLEENQKEQKKAELKAKIKEGKLTDKEKLDLLVDLL